MDMEKDTLSDFNRENNSNLAYTGAGDGNEPWNLPENPFDKTYDSGFLTEDKLESTENNTWRRHGYAIVKKISFNELVNDVINDFNRRYETEFTYKLVGGALVERLHLISTFEPIMCSDAYAFCFIVHNLLFDVNSASKDELKKLVRDEIYCEQENIFKETQGLNIDTSFSYKPEHLKKIHELSDQIFTEAKNVKILGEAKSIDADGLLAEMVSL